MAWDPCVSCDREFYGAAVYTYATWYVGETKFAYRLRHCTTCAANLRTEVEAKGDQRDSEGAWAPSPLLGPRRPMPVGATLAETKVIERQRRDQVRSIRKSRSS